jgi:hypothetical protein
MITKTQTVRRFRSNSERNLSVLQLQMPKSETKRNETATRGHIAHAPNVHTPRDEIRLSSDKTTISKMTKRVNPCRLAHIEQYVIFLSNFIEMHDYQTLIRIRRPNAARHALSAPLVAFALPNCAANRSWCRRRTSSVRQCASEARSSGRRRIEASA